MGFHRTFNLIRSFVIATNIAGKEPIFDGIACLITFWLFSELIATNKNINDYVFGSILFVANNLLTSFDSSLNICIICRHTVHESMAEQFSIRKHAWHRC